MMYFGMLAFGIGHVLYITSMAIRFPSYEMNLLWSASAGILLAGAILFVLSDMVLSMTYFSKTADYERKGMLNPESRLMIIVNHATYYLAQFLIALSLLYI